MDPLTSTVAAIGLTLALAGAVALVAWRHERSRARVPAVLLGLAVAVLAFPALIQVAGQAIQPPLTDAAGASEHPPDAVVSPDELKRR